MRIYDTATKETMIDLYRAIAETNDAIRQIFNTLDLDPFDSYGNSIQNHLDRSAQHLENAWVNLRG